jgi:hypothetical protein
MTGSSGCGTNANCPLRRAMSEFGCKAENICSQRVFRFLTRSGPAKSYGLLMEALA